MVAGIAEGDQLLSFSVTPVSSQVPFPVFGIQYSVFGIRYSVSGFQYSVFGVRARVRDGGRHCRGGAATVLFRHPRVEPGAVCKHIHIY